MIAGTESAAFALPDRPNEGPAIGRERIIDPNGDGAAASRAIGPFARHTRRDCRASRGDRRIGRTLGWACDSDAPDPVFPSRRTLPPAREAGAVVRLLVFVLFATRGIARLNATLPPHSRSSILDHADASISGATFLIAQCDPNGTPIKIFWS